MTGNGDSGAAGGIPALPGAAPRPAPRPPDSAGPGHGVGYRGPSACAAAGITYRQLDYWARTGLVEPSIRPAHGSGTQRLYSFRDVLVLKIVKRLLDAGVSLQSIRTAVHCLRAEDLAGLPGTTLLSDGAAVYRCTTAEEVAALLRDGRGVFGIAVGAVWSDVEAALDLLPAERIATGETVAAEHPLDELARRRKRTG